MQDRSESQLSDSDDPTPLLCPVLLLNKVLILRLTRGRTGGVMAHEIAHVRRAPRYENEANLRAMNSVCLPEFSGCDLSNAVQRGGLIEGLSFLSYACAKRKRQAGYSYMLAACYDRTRWPRCLKSWGPRTKRHQHARQAVCHASAAPVDASSNQSGLALFPEREWYVISSSDFTIEHRLLRRRARLLHRERLAGTKTAPWTSDLKRRQPTPDESGRDESGRHCKDGTEQPARRRCARESTVAAVAIATALRRRKRIQPKQRLSSDA